MTSISRGILSLALISSLAASGVLALQAPARTVNDGVYTAQQATRGQTVYTQRCANCHAANLAGRTGPPLAGEDFLSNWETQPLLELANKIHKTMPRVGGDPLTEQQSADVLAYILQAGKYPAGGTELAMDQNALRRINFPVRAGAAPRAAAATQQPALPVVGNVGQVMRGILFPSANILFTVQTIDPGVKRPPPKDDDPTGGFDWFTWGGSVYQGWEVVDYAAVSVAESATLMLTPGRGCENGRLVPVNDPDWIRFTQELADAGKAAYKASQTRNQQIASDVTNQLNDSCQNCHRVFRGRIHCAKP